MQISTANEGKWKTFGFQVDMIRKFKYMTITISY